MKKITIVGGGISGLAVLHYLKQLEKKKPVIVCGDFNVAHREIDLANPKENYNKRVGAS